METRQQLAFNLQAGQQKYNYYIIALAVACVGFSASITTGMKIFPLTLPLGIAVLSWFATVYTGLSLINWRIASGQANIELLTLQSGHHKIAGSNRQLIDRGTKTLSSILNDNNKKIINRGKVQIYSLYIGIIMFVIWRVL